jgi:transcriptional regulator with XRE-family HTH domain
MTKKTIHSLGAMVRARRGENKLRATAALIGISAPTLLRVEAGHIPDLEAFGKICGWLKVDPKGLLGIEEPRDDAEVGREGAPAVTISAHFKADRTARPATIHALATMLLLASNELAPTKVAVDDDP